ncbi:LutC/YkgG family protein [Nocardia transvalensis]|uniref:LutC/YkgG family protein n=1 Tax=Nocardia transvalensis TaxID=37333 RepID=UPI001895DE04|nr:LUD domain-containing protein [Nocardia transvalensis]MBF6333871.1 LUD domain-containing protein [Nocardia transvalensis]
MTAREEMLRRVRDALKALPDDERTVTLPRHYRSHAPEDRPAIVEMFAERLRESGARVVRASTRQIPAIVTEALNDHAIDSVVAPEGLPLEWLTAWAESDGHRVVTDHPLVAADEPDAVVTGCAGAVADSATIVLDGGPGQGRAATLAAGCHICIVRAEQIDATLPDVLDKLDPQRPITWFRGPTATADTDAVPVPTGQGPRRLVVVIVE